jgi:hypothetical protein
MPYHRKEGIILSTNYKWLECSSSQYSNLSDLRQVGGFLRVPRVPFTNIADHPDITELLLKRKFLIMRFLIQGKAALWPKSVY